MFLHPKYTLKIGVTPKVNNTPIKYMTIEMSKTTLLNFPVTSHPFPSVKTHARLLFGNNMKMASITIKIPAPKNIQFLTSESEIIQGKIVIIDTTAAPPANVATIAGRTQQISVPKEPNNVNMLINLFFNLTVS